MIGDHRAVTVISLEVPPRTMNASGLRELRRVLERFTGGQDRLDVRVAGRLVRMPDSYTDSPELRATLSEWGTVT